MALLFFSFIAAEFLLRFAYDRPIRHGRCVTNYRGVVDRNIGLMIFGLSTMTSVLLIRSIYRTAELSDGWSGAIISTQWLFSSSMLINILPSQSANHHSFVNTDTFDGAMIVSATFTLNILHPGLLLRGYDNRFKHFEAGTISRKEKIARSPSIQSGDSHSPSLLSLPSLNMSMESSDWFPPPAPPRAAKCCSWCKQPQNHLSEPGARWMY